MFALRLVLKQSSLEMLLTVVQLMVQDYQYLQVLQLCHFFFYQAQEDCQMNQCMMMNASTPCVWQAGEATAVRAVGAVSGTAEGQL